MTLTAELIAELRKLKRDPRFLPDPWEEGHRVAIDSALDVVRRIARRRSRKPRKKPR